MNSVEVIRELIRNELNWPDADISMTSDLPSLGLDSLKMMSVFLELERRFHLVDVEGELTFESFRTIETIMIRFGIPQVYAST